MGIYANMGWHEQAACADSPMDWYPEASEDHITVKELADRIGMNISTTQRALNGSERVSVEVLDQVIEGVKEHGYTPDRTRDTRYLNMLRETCNSCPVLDKCFAHALKYERYGFWGGTSANERAIIRRNEGILVVDPMYGVDRDSV